MLDTIGFDGFRVDAIKHVPPGYFAWAPDQAASQGFTNGDLVSRLFRSNPDMTIFGEGYTTNTYELREYGKTGINLLDFPLVFKLKDIFNSNGSGNIGAALGNGYSVDSATGMAYQLGGLSPDTSVSFVQSHDDGPPTSSNLSYGYILARPGRPKVYYDGNNIQPGAWNNFPRPGRYDSLGNGGDRITKLVRARSLIGRGNAIVRNAAANTLVFERQVSGKPVMLAGFNNRGDNTALTVTVSTGYTAGQILEDYTGQRPPVTVGANGAVTMTIPSNFSSTESNNGTGYVYYALPGPKPQIGIDTIELYGEGVKANERGGDSRIPFANIVTPIGTFGTQTSYDAATLTGQTVSIMANFDASATSCLVRLNNGVESPGRTKLINTPESIVENFIPMEATDVPGQFSIRKLDISNLNEGLNLLKIRAFRDTQNDPGIFTDKNVFVYVKRNLPTNWQVDGDLTDFGTANFVQTRSPGSNNNRLDSIYVTNDDQFVYMGLAGRVDGSEGFLNGVSLAIDSDGNSATGVRDFATINDDISPATRLISNTKLNMPSNFGADHVLGVFRNSSLTSAPEAPFPGLLENTPKVGAMAGFYRVNSSNLSVLDPLRVVISTQIRNNTSDPAKGIEVAVPISTMFPTGVPASGQMRFVGWLGTTGERGSFLTSNDPLRASLGGRPAPNGYVTNQIIPTQPAILSDPGTNVANIQFPLTVNLRMMQAVLATTATVNAGSLIFNGRTNTYSQNVTIRNISAATLAGPLALRVSGLPSGATVVNKSGDTLVLPKEPYVRLNTKGIGRGLSATITIRYSSASTFSPTLTLLSGRGIL